MIKVIGIDPAPTKKSTVYDGIEFQTFCYKKLKEYLNDLKEQNEKILICWDAPLSFSTESFTPFSKRNIEKFFSRKEGSKTPPGISIMGYSSCPHWIISQYLLGYPRISDQSFNHPFNLIFDNKEIAHAITEVHPAVAIWMWLLKGKIKIESWKYKKNKTDFNKIVNELKNQGILPTNLQIENDDRLDAFISWRLGADWIQNNNEVEILGDAVTGSFLLPYNQDVFDKFKNFQYK